MLAATISLADERDNISSSRSPSHQPGVLRMVVDTLLLLVFCSQCQTARTMGSLRWTHVVYFYRPTALLEDIGPILGSVFVKDSLNSAIRTLYHLITQHSRFRCLLNTQC